ncbi:MAG: glycosyltransferase [Solirubrobacteraceae bacterium]
MPDTPTASIVIPTRHRAGYLAAALNSIAPQARALDAEVIVVNDGDDPSTSEVARRHGAKVVPLAPPGGANAGRNAGIDAAAGDLLVFVDDDVDAPDDWLQAILTGAARSPGVEVFGGPIRARLEGGGPRACGREPAPITTLDLGPEDRDVELVWSANMAIRRSAITRAGRFDESIQGRGEEEEWERRYADRGGVVRYLAAAGLDHRRTVADSRISSLSRAAYWHGRAARAYDVRKGVAPPLVSELRTLTGCGWHTVRRKCAFGVAMGAHSAGRVREALTHDHGHLPTAADGCPDPNAPVDFLSGEGGEVSGIRATTRAVVVDAVADGFRLLTGEPLRLRRAARALPPRRVLALAVERADQPNLLAAARAELAKSRHAVTFESCDVGGRGKFENLNLLLERALPAEHDWLLVLDDDVRLPHGFLDSFLFLAERFGLSLAQPAHRARSHAAWRVTRRQTPSLVRQTAWVEIGPVVAFHRSTFDVLLPFPPLRMGWGLDAHWAAIARERGWRLGIVDATAIGHGFRTIAAGYAHGEAVAESRSFLRDRPHITPAEAQRTLATHRRWS